MEWKQSLDRMRALFDGTTLDSRLAPAYPSLAIEIDPDRIAGVRLHPDRKDGRVVVRRAAWSDLPAGCIEPSLSQPNIVDPKPVAKALDEVLRSLGSGEHRASLLLPDHVARVSILGFNVLPGTRRELQEMVRFRMAKSLPFKTEEAALDVMPLGGAVGAAQGPVAGSVLAVFMHRPVLEQYESLLLTRGYWPGLVALSTFELFNLFRKRLEEGDHGTDRLLLNLTRRYLSILILSRGQILFYRCKPHASGTDLTADVTGLRRELYTSLAFYQEKLLGRGIGAAWLRASGVPAEPILEAVRAETGCAAALLRLADRVTPGDSVALDPEQADLVAPAVGAAAGRIA
jgi:Tfp pilus assembly PilM family ATPase